MARCISILTTDKSIIFGFFKYRMGCGHIDILQTVLVTGITSSVNRGYMDRQADRQTICTL